MMVPAHVFCTLLFSTFLQLVSTANAKCPLSFDCGNLGKIHFPFTDSEHPECGLLAIHGCNDRYPDAVKTIRNQGRWFYVVELDQFTIVDRDEDLHSLLLSRRCGVFNKNYTFETTSPFFSLHILKVTLFSYNRTLNVTPPATTSKSTICSNDIFYDAATMEDEFLSSKDCDLYFASCSMVRLPIRDTGLKPDPKGDLFDFISADIPIQIQISPTTRPS
ncbi:hypothetical protein SESBI_31160 [Sesbania bispinosa]|nr:hypothetical protein SESBI_31160 [Sesbania bispinosa]